MFELPEIVTLSRQLASSVSGRAVCEVDVSASRPRFLFLTPEPDTAFRSALKGRTLLNVRSRGKWIFSDLSDGNTLLIGEFGGRLLLQESKADPPKKVHLAIALDDASTLFLTIQMWGFVGVLTPDNLRTHPYAGTLGPSLLDPTFTQADFDALLTTSAQRENKPVKAFLTHEANVCGIGNGYLQDILFLARLSPRRKVADIATDERVALYRAIQETLQRAVELEGRDSESTLYGDPGRYVPLLDKRAVGMPCPSCGRPIQRVQYLGGSCYLCPSCQT